MSRLPAREAFAAKVSDKLVGDNVIHATEHTLRRRASLIQDFGPRWPRLTQRAKLARERSVNDREQLLARFTEVASGRGWHIHRVSSASDAAARITSLVTDAGRSVIKSKSLTTEEISLNSSLEAAGVDVVETDLGELIVQLAGEPPSHVTAPAIHMSTEQIARLFRDRLGMNIPQWVDAPQRAPEDQRKALAQQLSLHARAHLREKFLGADVGITGANFLVADTGTIVLLENEGNIQLTACLPKRHIVVAGVDKVIASDDDLQALLQVLPVSATAQRQTCYVSMFADPHPDVHLVLLDDGRSKISSHDYQRDVLRCIRCGACMNVCPVYRNTGGHAYQGAYPGPIGALLMPQLAGGAAHVNLPFACSVCGACTEVCPVQIPLDSLLLRLRGELVNEGLANDFRTSLAAATEVMKSSKAFSLAEQLYPGIEPIAHTLPLASRWHQQRNLPPAATETFRQWWSRTQGPPANKQERNPSNHDPAPLSAPTLPTRQPMHPETASSDQTVQRDDPASLLSLWQERFAELGNAEQVVVWNEPRWADAVTRLREHLHRLAPQSIACAPHVPLRRTHDVGISQGSLLIAETGGVILDYPSRAHAKVGILAIEHIVFVDPTAIVPGIDEAVAYRKEARASGDCSGMQVFVTGPSRTADVEKVLVIPAHGPKTLIVVLTRPPWHWTAIADLCSPPTVH